MTFKLFEIQISRRQFVLEILGFERGISGYASLLYIRLGRHTPSEFEILWTHPLISWWRWEREKPKRVHRGGTSNGQGGHDNFD